ncbi:MAG: hypothetical protein A2W00_02130 [Candidatus Eisenbacteria bacterium RBG_16_71_46]|nr:MAG: hypothetical protein A2W00_02130 [Candidatus Eisenbacteria bacterium RBG_16_71_46]OGF22555.1 MAG: hypothetical protein A2V63_00845 [Candidatus Eisenbacteria bacterium RBG_19FT_COMBO_70_11]
MNRRLLVMAAFAAMMVGPVTSRADAAAAGFPMSVSPLALATAGAALPEVSFDASAAPAVAVVSAAAVRNGFESVTYRPRSRHYRRERSVVNGSQTQLHAGFFDPDGDAERGFLFGMRGGPKVDDRVQLGGGVDWRYKSESRSELVGESTGPGGEKIVIRRELSRSSSNFFPIMAFLQIDAGDDLPVIPYFGVSGGYELLFLSAADFNTGESFDATFGGWGWQLWGGAALPLSGRSRLNAEVFVNGADLHRDTEDLFTGQTVREIVNMDGVGARFGLSWGF